ncbi:hypothetical protein KIH31_16310 [Paenarthrobacter sp. DKR-5]|uniref:hypothetical protein n=1 Tax=Paenarthrobacter sp. DKR-5 TaxID=2835535 RepID=UPI001BDD0FAE|nr:hypothetical protein [Paenarthrobacter sp. DKR-5]MBT1004151.1 hypothetical protein [Paenarthrobacter sp. DKR-5]
MSKTPAQRAAKHGPNAASTASGASARAGTSRRPGAPANPTTARTPEQARGNASMILIAAAVASVLLYAYELFVGLPELAGLAGGRAMPETLVFGYGSGYLQDLRAAMNEPALNVYQHFHSTADTLFPLLFAFTWLLLLNQLLPAGRLRLAFFVLPVLYAAADLAENGVLDAVMRSAPFDAGLAGTASVLTVLKFALFALCLLAAAVAPLLSRRLSRRARAAGPEGGAPARSR